MDNKILYKETVQEMYGSGLVHTSMIYEGYGQELTIRKSGCGDAGVIYEITPLSPCGVNILMPAETMNIEGMANLQSTFGVMESEVENYIDDLQQAVLFCKEFRRRRSEFVAAYNACRSKDETVATEVPVRPSSVHTLPWDGNRWRDNEIVLTGSRITQSGYRMEFEGYGQRIKVWDLDDGKAPVFTIQCKDPIADVNIILPAAIDGCNPDDEGVLNFRKGVYEYRVDEAVENLRRAVLFCKEFRRRKGVILNMMSTFKAREKAADRAAAERKRGGSIHA